MTEPTNTSNEEQGRFELVQQLYFEIDLLSAEERERAFETSTMPADVIAEVRKMFGNREVFKTGKLTRVVEAAKRDRPPSKFEKLIGSVLGDYRLTEIVGRGGTGVVFMARLKGKQFSSRVAIKVIDADIDPSLRTRFTSEHQILAKLQHPYVASLLQVGETADKDPYLVMEFIHGLTIEKFCDRKTASIRERLELFLKVCEAVQYAHQNLIVHRDLKPSNILVTEDGTPKLLDFGIARLLAQDGVVQQVTRYRDRALTPEYASPEQILGNPITTTSDVYSLGVLLHDLLTGFVPYDVTEKSSLEVERLICIVDPPRPSAMLDELFKRPQSTHSLLASKVVDARKTTERELVSTLRGDLDAIILRALRKEPGKRYSSVEAFAADIRSYLAHRPAIARQGNWWYYSQRFLRRNAIPAFTVSVLAIGMLTATVVSTVFYHREHVAMDHLQVALESSEQVSSFMSGIFRNATPYNGSAHDVTALDLLYAANGRINDLSNDNLAKLTLTQDMGDAFAQLGEYSTAKDLFEKALVLHNKFHPTDQSGRAPLLLGLASAEVNLGTFPAANNHLQQAYDAVSENGLATSAANAKLLTEMGHMENELGQLKTAESYYLRSISQLKTLKMDQSVAMALSLSDLSQLYAWMNQLDKAKDVGHQALTIVESQLPETHPDRIFVQLILAEVLAQSRAYKEAELLLEKSVNAQRVMYHNRGPELATSLGILASNKMALRQFTDAETLLREGIADYEQSMGPAYYQIGYYQTTLARLSYIEHNYPQAESHARTALSILTKSLPPNHQYISSAEYWLGEILFAQHKEDEAKKFLQHALDSQVAVTTPQWFKARTQSALAAVEAQQGKCKTVLPVLRTSYQQLSDERGKNDDSTQLALSHLRLCEHSIMK